MSDIITRLRDPSTATSWAAADAQRAEAADEIDALRELLRQVRAERDELAAMHYAAAERKPLTDKQLSAAVQADDTLRYFFSLNGGAGPVSAKGILICRAFERAFDAAMARAKAPQLELSGAEGPAS